MKLVDVVEMVAMVNRCSALKHKRHPVDVLSDRIRQTVTSPNLVSFMEKLVTAMDVESERIEESVVQGFLAAANSPHAKAIHAWFREHPRFAAMISNLKTQRERLEACQGIQIVDSEKPIGTVANMRPYDIPIKVTCVSQIAHGADHKAGNATLFRRQDVLTDTGVTLELPFYAANSVRGQLRDLLADHFLTALGFGTRRDKPVVEQWFFQALYSGGALEEKGSATMKKLGKVLGNNGAIRTDGIRQFRDMLPGLSLLGCSIGNKILPGRIQVGDLRPVCSEWGTGDVPASELLTWTFLTRRDDREEKGDGEEHSGMIATTEVLKAGSVMIGGIDVDCHCAPLEASALGLALELFRDRGLLGAETRRGMGRVTVDVTGAADPAVYAKFLESRKAEIIAFLKAIGALSEDAA